MVDLSLSNYVSSQWAGGSARSRSSRDACFELSLLRCLLAARHLVFFFPTPRAAGGRDVCVVGSRGVSGSSGVAAVSRGRGGGSGTVETVGHAKEVRSIFQRSLFPRNGNVAGTGIRVISGIFG